MKAQLTTKNQDCPIEAFNISLLPPYPLFVSQKKTHTQSYLGDHLRQVPQNDAIIYFWSNMKFFVYLIDLHLLLGIHIRESGTSYWVFT